jgi:hypothetical protein
MKIIRLSTADKDRSNYSNYHESTTYKKPIDLGSRKYSLSPPANRCSELGIRPHTKDPILAKSELVLLSLPKVPQIRTVGEIT